MNVAAAARELIVGPRERPPEPPTAFPDLVRAHWRWQGGLRGAGGEPSEAATVEYAKAVAAFERREGELKHAYWSTSQPSAIAVTVRGPSAVGRLFGKECDYRLHMASDWAIGRPASPLARVLQRCHLMSINSSEVLRGPPERITMESLFSVASHVLGFVDRWDGEPTAADAEAVAADQHVHLDAIASYYDRAANKAARIVFSMGMLIGFVWVVLLAGITAMLFELFGLFDESTAVDAKTFFACFALGALGAFVSVMTRMSQRNKFTLDTDLGRGAIRRLAAFRPILGGIFGVVAFVIVKSGVLQVDLTQFEFYILATAAFLAGFSERFTRMALNRVGNRFSGSEPPGGGTDGGADELEPEPAARG